MANVKFSQFTAANPLAATGFVVGYDSASSSNVRVSLANLKTSIGAFTLDQTLAAGATLTASRTISMDGFNTVFNGTGGTQVFRMNSTGYVVMGSNATSKGLFIFDWPNENLRMNSYFSGTLATNGLDIDFVSGTFKLGSLAFAGTRSGIHLSMVDTVVGLSAQLYYQGSPGGFGSDFAAGTHFLGDYNNKSNGTYLLVNDGNQQVEIRAANSTPIALPNTAPTASAFTSSGNYLPIDVGGVTYYIDLQS